MTLILERFSDNGDSTLGLLYKRVNGYKCYYKQFLCYTIEDEKRAVKVHGETRIPNGTYRLALRTEGGFHARYTERFGTDFHKGMIQLMNVHNFENILIHTGNTDEDTAGCILVGDKSVQNITREGAVESSTDAYKRIYPDIAMSIMSEDVSGIKIEDVTVHDF
tara:strand:+ start:508 stop:999 length:492 start_codon:yes stop_codon:yes gene_type:complete